MNHKILLAETDRLIIRPYKLDDYTNWLTQHNERKVAQNPYDNGYTDMSTSTKESFNQWISDFHHRAMKDELHVWGVFRKSDGVHIGKIELFTILRMDYQWAMMGYSILNQHWGNGYGTEAVLAATRLIFDKLGFHRIELHINTDNHLSVNLAEKAGFEYECTRKSFSYEDHEWKDFLIYYQNNENEER
ncbi:MAG: GNAT family N-acetyltransferase [Paenisporosarcina sp.]